MISTVRRSGALDLVAMGVRLRETRENLGLPSTTLDELANVARGTVHRVEHGTRPELSLVVLARLARYLEVSLDWLVWGTEERVPSSYGFDGPSLAFLNQVHRYPGLTAYLETPLGARVPLHTLVRGLRIMRDKPPELDKSGVPVEGWGVFFKKLTAPSNGVYSRSRPKTSKKMRPEAKTKTKADPA